MEILVGLLADRSLLILQLIDRFIVHLYKQIGNLEPLAPLQGVQNPFCKVENPALHINISHTYTTLLLYDSDVEHSILKDVCNPIPIFVQKGIVSDITSSLASTNILYISLY